MKLDQIKYETLQIITTSLLAWFARHQRDLPWRRKRTPYRVLLSEMMLQQTQVTTVIPYYDRFIERWPTLHVLADAEPSDIRRMWQGLGYYRRADALHRIAKICRDTTGSLPDRYDELLKLPGIGPYTAAAIASLAFGEPRAVVDGNVVRVFSRLTASAIQPEKLADREKLRHWLESFIPTDQPGNFNEAVMDLGATICLPLHYSCSLCPLNQICLARLNNRIPDFPPPKRSRPLKRQSLLYLDLRLDGKIYLRKRSQRLLQNLYEPYLWQQLDEIGSAADSPPVPGEVPAHTRIAPGQPLEIDGQIYHIQQIEPAEPIIHRFSHLIWDLQILRVDLNRNASAERARANAKAVDTSAGPGQWYDFKELAQIPLPKFFADYFENCVKCQFF